MHRSCTNVYLVVNILAVGHTTYGKTPLIPNRIGYDASEVYTGGRKPIIRSIHDDILVLLADQFDAFFDPKNTQETNATNEHSANLKNVRVVVLPMVTLKSGDNASHLHAD